MDDFALTQRIKAAVLFHRSTLLAGAVSNARNYAIIALLNPSQLDPTMLALVCVDPAVAALIVVPPDGSTVDTTGVTDALILTTVISKWALVAPRRLDHGNVGPPESMAPRGPDTSRKGTRFTNMYLIGANPL